MKQNFSVFSLVLCCCYKAFICVKYGSAQLLTGYFYELLSLSIRTMLGGRECRETGSRS